MDLKPGFKSNNFICPHCNIASQQIWFDVYSAGSASNTILNRFFYKYRKNISVFKEEAIGEFISELEVVNNKFIRKFVPDDFAVSTCITCSNISLWIDRKIVYPKKTTIPVPNPDMDQEIQDLYIEASTIVVDSPKGATALLRLALQLLLKQLGKPGKNINNDIKELVADGLNPLIQQALDVLRVVGNNAVHPGQIDLDDQSDIALKLFDILNYIANEMITKPQELILLYTNVIPEETRQHINNRDGKLPST